MRTFPAYGMLCHVQTHVNVRKQENQPCILEPSVPPCLIPKNVLKHFHELGLIHYDGRIRVNRSLLNAILHDQMPGDNAAKPPITDISKAN